ncbi:MAG TPA: alpha/beta hydrolase [Euzebyales bacterium]|nr:alpha/beta hydrolase [Euzebyales bacterium]
MSSGTMVVDGIRSPLLSAGPPAADEAVVFVHGNPGPSEDWRSLVAATGMFARAVAFDMPGYGGADKPADFSYTVEGYARHLGRMIDAAGISRTHLVAHDFGGPWGLAWAHAHPDRVASLTLMNIGVMPGYRWHLPARIWRTPVLGELSLRTTTLPAIRSVLRRGTPRGLPEAVVERTYRAFKDRGVQRTILALYRSTSVAVLGSADLQDDLRRLDLPVLVVWGAHDPYVDVGYAERQRETFPRAQVVILRDSGHWPMLDDPVAVEQAVTGFLRRHVTTGH